jgi:hypothetical protein
VGWQAKPDGVILYAKINLVYYRLKNIEDAENAVKNEDFRGYCVIGLSREPMCGTFFQEDSPRIMNIKPYCQRN